MTQLTPIRGFTNTPVTKSICIISTLLAIGLLTLQLKHYVRFAIDPLLVEYYQYWRILTFQLSVINESDYLLCTVLWFHFKTLERFFGPRKYLSLIALMVLYNGAITFLFLSLSQLLQNCLLSFLRVLILHEPFRFYYTDTIFNSITPGPLGVVSSLYICFATYVPVSYHFTIVFRKPGSTQATNKLASLTLNDHFQIQLIYLLLLLNNGISSLLPCLVGLLIGKLYTADLLPGSKNWSLPDLAFSLFVNPRNIRVSSLRNLRRRVRGYQPVSDQLPLPRHPLPIEDRDPTPDRDDEDHEEAVDDIRNGNENIQRSATPVRPLGRQFLDTFRT